MHGKLAHVRALLYTRQSRIAGDDELAVLRQQQDGRKLAELRAWHVEQALCDNDFSAAGKKLRPGFEQLLQAIDSGGYRAVIAWSLDRLTRNARDRLRLIEACAKHAVTIALVRGADIDPSSPGGRLVAGILGEVAEHEIAQKADRQRRAAQQAAEAGLPWGGRRPFGFAADKVTLHPDEAAALRVAYDEVLAGMPLGAVARGLNEQGFTTTQRSQVVHGCVPPCRRQRPVDCPTPQGGEPSPWTAQNLRYVLLNPRYMGVRAVTVLPEHGRATWRVVGPARWEAVVSPEVWHAVEGILSDPGRRNAPQSGQAMLTGVALCAVDGCGATVHGGRSSRKAKTYRCSASMGHLARVQKPVDEHIGLLVCERLSREDAVDLLASPGQDLGPLRAELAAVRDRLRKAPGLWEEGVLSDDELRDVKARLPVRIADLERRLGDSGRADLLRPLVNAEDIEHLWFVVYDDDRRRAVVEVLMTVRLHPPGRGKRLFDPATVDLDWKDEQG